MRRLLRFLLPVLILGAGTAAFVALKATRPEPAAPEVQERVWRVEAQPVTPQPLAPELLLYGRVETPELLRATASAEARVAEVRVRDGNRVREGDLLLRLDERDFRPRIAQAQAEVADLEAQIESEKNQRESDRLALEQERRLLELARQAVARQERLKSQRVGAEQALDDAKQAEAQQALVVSNREMRIADHPSRLRALEARLARAQARLEELQLEFERATVRAPFDGIVTAVEVTEGDQAADGAPLVSLYALDGLEVRARIPAPYQSELTMALARGEPLPASAALGGAGGERIALRLARLAGEADPSGVEALFAIDGDPARLRLGQLLTVHLQRPEQPDAVAVPFEAVYGGERVYVVEDGRMRGVAIENLGEQQDADGGQRLLVRSPELEAGDQLVTTHMPNALEGLRVEVVGAEPTVAGPPSAGSARGAGEAVQ